LSRWRGSTWAAIAWTAILWLFFGYLVVLAIKYGGATYSDTAVFGGAGLLFLWLVGLGIVGVDRVLTDRWQAKVMAGVGTSESPQASDTAPTPRSGTASIVVRHVAAAIAGTITTFAVSIALQVILDFGPATIVSLVAGSAAAGVVLGGRGPHRWARAALLLLVTLLLLGVLVSLIQLLVEPM
jgi:hypothetical protein